MASFVIALFFQKAHFSFDVWGQQQHLGSTLGQIKSTMLVTLWVFIGIEGAVVVSDTSPLLQTEFGWADAIRFLDRADLDAAPAAIAEALASPDAQLTADQGRALVEARHLWTHRAARLVDILEGISRSAG